MSVLAGKLLTPLISPLGLALLLWLVGALLSWLGRRGWGRGCRAAGCLLLLLLSSPLVGEHLLHRLEVQYPLSAAQDSPSAEAIVVLGGFTQPPLPPRPNIDVDEGFDRLLHGLRLWRAGKAPLLVFSGGNIPYLTGSSMTEAASLCSLALEYGVDPRAILLEEESRNTYENALYTGRLLRERGLNRVLLVTSAAHMPRAVAVFRKQGLEVLPAPTDLQVVTRSFNLFQLMPGPAALAYSNAAIKEQVGMWIYWLRGWV
jgi:uncharacterized SAM-binding protein YcdF (DUF218 family)